MPKNEVPLDTSPGDSYISVLVDMLFEPLHGPSLLPPLSQYDLGLFLTMERPNPSLQAGVWVESRLAPGGLQEAGPRRGLGWRLGVLRTPSPRKRLQSYYVVLRSHTVAH